MVKPKGNQGVVKTKSISKCVLVGNNNVGKSSLILTHKMGCFPEYTFSVCEYCESVVEYDGKQVTLGLLDTMEEDEYDRLRPICYPQTDVFLICFSMVDPYSYEAVVTKWYPEITQHCPNVPIILVGTKKDLCSDPGTIGKLKKSYFRQAPLTTKDGCEMAERIGAIRFIECSAFLQKGVDDVFIAAGGVSFGI